MPERLIHEVIVTEDGRTILLIGLAPGDIEEDDDDEEEGDD